MLSHRNLFDLVNATSGAGLVWFVWTGVKAVRWIKTKKWRFWCLQLCLFYNIPRKNWACWVIHQWIISYNITAQKASIVSWSICWPLCMIWGLLQVLDMNQHHFFLRHQRLKINTWAPSMCCITCSQLELDLDLPMWVHVALKLQVAITAVNELSSFDFITP